MQIRTNIINQNVARKIQQEALHIIADSVKMSFGPKGSMAAITDYINKEEREQGIIIKHTKDGHNIIKHIKFLNPIERSVQDLIVDMTSYIVKDVGDGTTSAAILSSLIFDEFCNMEFDKNLCPSDIIQEFSKRVKLVNELILSKGRECTLEDIYDICMISTNGNKELTDTLYEVYKKFGKEVYINIEVSPRVFNIVKEYDGMTLETGFANTAFINDKSTNSARVQNPNIYIFKDPIDTPEMISYFNAIVEKNIMIPLKNLNKPRTPQQTEVNKLIPTVILCKRITPDISSYLETLIQFMNTNPGAVPFILVSEIHQEYMLEDILMMTGAKWIKKYIDPEVQKSDQEQGLAPTIENVHEWYGTSDEVRSDQYKTQFIRPKKMFNDDGTYSDKYNMMLNYLSSQIEKATDEGAGINEVATLKRRYNSFKGDMVDFLVGGISLSDREALKSSLEDAVFNVRSAVANGVGYGSNFMAFSTIKELLAKKEYAHDVYLQLLCHAYFELLVCLYKNSFPTRYEDIIKDSLVHNCPLNIRTEEYDHKVLSSIKSDVVILETINKIVTMMYITNQYLLPNVAINAYDNITG